MMEKLLKLLTNPWAVLLGVIGAIASIIGIPLTIYLSNPSPELSFCENPVRTPIVTPGKPSSLHVSYEAKEIVGPVTALQVKFWNAGRQAVQSTNIEKPWQLELPKCQILEAKILSLNREEVGFTLDTTRQQDGLLRFSWSVLEQNDTAILQLIFNGDATTPVVISGSALGQAKVRARVAYGLNTKSSRSIALYQILTGSLSCVVLVMLVVKKPSVPKKRPIWLLLAIGIVFIFCFVNVVWEAISYASKVVF